MAHGSERLVKTTLELKDVVMIVTTAIGIASAFFMYDKRLAVVELETKQTTHLLEQIQADNQRREQDSNNQREQIDHEISGLKTEIEILKLNQEVQMGLRHRRHIQIRKP